MCAGCLIVEGATAASSAGADRTLPDWKDERGNRIPDFSHCGYRGSAAAIPAAPVRVVVAASGDDGDGDDDDDDGARIQAAIDHVGSLPGDDDGLRGAVLLLPGRYRVPGQLQIRSSGVVLRGSGTGESGTVLVATGEGRRTLIRVVGRPHEPSEGGFESGVADSYVPVGATRLELTTTEGLRAGDRVFVDRPSTREWIADLGMDAFGVGWRPGSRDLRWDRTITSVDGRTVTIDAPITTAIEARYGGGRVSAYSWPGRVEQAGIENLRLESEVAPDAPWSEDHAWVGITMENAQNAWVRQVDFVHFAGGAVCLWESTKWITVEDCSSREPVSEVGGGRRRTFFTMGQLTLFLRCWSESGRSDFTAGHAAAGPNGFVSCTAKDALGDSGAMGSWASGVLFDNVRIDGGGLVLENRWSLDQGAGWAAAGSVIWQCSASEIRCFRPPTAQNWSFGAWGSFAGDAYWQSRNGFVQPRSLYLGQLEARLGGDASTRQGPVVEYPRGSTNPTPGEAAAMAGESSGRAPTVLDLIDTAAARNPIPIDRGSAPGIGEILAKSPPPRRAPAQKRHLAIEGGWLTVNGRLKTGRTLRPIWWRGNTRPAEAPGFGPAITRFVPGRVGTGSTDDLREVADHMVSSGIAALEHHYGLWYDRRRDDHQRVRRRDPSVTPPFYELPFARSGRGTAWDGLSRYDLTRNNPWYWSRLETFADLCDREGLVLVHQSYFQHHLLEAGAHWADFPWRSANNVNATGFPEPPPYAGDKRIFQAHLFYDPAHPARRPLHRAYLRRCLEAFAGNSNVIQLTSAEFTGPLRFVEFWIDTIVEWERETGRDAIIGLSATKDVQDAILADPRRSPAVSVIDIRYWWYQSSGELYAPGGGQNLSPRQLARQLRPRGSSFEQVVRAVREYRDRFPSKAVIYSAGPVDPWAVLMGGGSLPPLASLDGGLGAAVPRLRPADDVVSGPGRWCLSHETAGCLIYAAATGGPLAVDLTPLAGKLVVRWIDPDTGKATRSGRITGGREVDLQLPPRAPGIVWLSRE